MKLKERGVDVVLDNTRHDKSDTPAQEVDDWLNPMLFVPHSGEDGHYVSIRISDYHVQVVNHPAAGPEHGKDTRKMQRTAQEMHFGITKTKHKATGCVLMVHQIDFTYVTFSASQPLCSCVVLVEIVLLVWVVPDLHRAQRVRLDSFHRLLCIYNLAQQKRPVSPAL